MNTEVISHKSVIVHPLVSEEINTQPMTLVIEEMVNLEKYS